MRQRQMRQHHQDIERLLFQRAANIEHHTLQLGPFVNLVGEDWHTKGGEPFDCTSPDAPLVLCLAAQTLEERALFQQRGSLAQMLRRLRQHCKRSTHFPEVHGTLVLGKSVAGQVSKCEAH